MQELASAVRENIDALAETCAQRLQAIDGYRELSDQARREAARHVLQLALSLLETGDTTSSAQFTQAMATARLQQGFDLESVQQAL